MSVAVGLPESSDFWWLKPEDVPYEENVLRNRYDLKTWLRYLEFKSRSPKEESFVLYERALQELPGSYKLWHRYLKDRVNGIKDASVTDKVVEDVLSCFERALVTMHKMPRIWLEYLEILCKTHFVTRTRRTFDRSLRSLPITQHHRIWKLYIPWVRKIGIAKLTIHVYRRYLMVEPSALEEYVDVLLSLDQLNEAAECLKKMLNEDIPSTTGQSKHQIWVKLTDLVTKHPDRVQCVRVEPVIREGLSIFTNETGRLWIALAEYYIRLGNFSKARDIFEEAIHTVITLRDFVQIWDAYTMFEDKLLEMDMKEDDDDANLEFDLRIARYEHLIEQRPLLVNSVKLRQNPHNVVEWLGRAELYGEDLGKVVETYTAAVKTVDAQRATGKPHALWISFAKFYEKHGDVSSARQIFRAGTQSTLKTVDDLACVWCEWAEMELRNGEYERALELIREAAIVPRNKRVSRQQPVQKRIFKSLQLWSMLVDMEESLGTFLSTKAAYDQILELRIATPRIVLNYASFLEEHNHFEESFKAYERGVGLFEYPHVMDLWLAYLTKFVERYKGTKLERTRDLFEQAIEHVPAKDAKTLYLMYAHVEEEYGLARHAMSVYDRATRAVADEDKLLMYNIYIARATAFFGITKTREIYDAAVASLPDTYVMDVGTMYAALERKLGEIDRARAIYTHVAQYCDPKKEEEFWETWNGFEVQHGNEETFREMLRVKRSVQAQYTTSTNLMVGHGFSANKPSEEEKAAFLKKFGFNDQMEELERQQQHTQAEMTAAPGAAGISYTAPAIAPADDPVVTTAAATETRNSDEIDLGLDDMDDMMEDEEAAGDGDGDDDDGVTVTQKEVPAAVFGGLSAAAPKEDEDEGLGALERFKKRKMSARE